MLRDHVKDSSLHTAESTDEACEAADIVIATVTANAAFTAAEQTALFPKLG
ncbi:hypothetical protein [Microvirga sp. P5_D2]